MDENERRLQELKDRELTSTITDQLNDNLVIGPKPTIDRSLKPVDKKKSNLRNIIIPHDLCKQFLDVADSNTKKNVETCGILAGKLVSSSYLLTKILLNLN